MKRGLTLVELLVVIAIIAVLVAIFVPPLTPHPGHKSFICLRNLQKITSAAHTYAEDYKGKLPIMSNWCDLLVDTELIDTYYLRCPGRPEQKCGYAMNKYLDSINLKDVIQPEEIVLFFESELGWNAHGGPEAILYEPAHRGCGVVFLDGHVAIVPQEEIANLMWKPALASEDPNTRSPSDTT